MNNVDILLKLRSIASEFEKDFPDHRSDIFDDFREMLFKLDDEYRKLFRSLKGDGRLSILLLGDRRSIFMRTLVRNLKLFFGENILIGIAGPENAESYSGKLPRTFEDYYFKTHESSMGNLLKKIKNFIYLRRSIDEAMKKLRPILVNIHYLQWYWALVLDKLKQYNIIVTIWGSDMYRESLNPRVKSSQIRVLEKSKLITAGNEILIKDVLKIYGDKFRDKIRIAAFGTPIDLLEHDDITYDDIRNFKSKFGILSDKKILIVGSSANPGEHHKEIISALKSFKSEIFAVVPMTYGSMKYREEVEGFFKKSGLEGVVLKDYLSNREMATLKVIADVVVFLPTTDAFSAFLQESLYAGNVVITGRWLPYDWMDEYGIYCHRIDKPEVEIIKEKLEQVLNNLNEEKEKSQGNKEKILRIGAWQYRFKDWLKVYAEALGKEGQ